MEGLEFLQDMTTMLSVWLVIMVLAIVDAVLKAFALWRSARKNQTGWFICLFVFNTVGILPLIYLLLNRKNNDD
jgi:small basic protein